MLEQGGRKRDEGRVKGPLEKGCQRWPEPVHRMKRRAPRGEVRKDDEIVGPGRMGLIRWGCAEEATGQPDVVERGEGEGKAGEGPDGGKEGGRERERQGKDQMEGGRGGGGKGRGRTRWREGGRGRGRRGRDAGRRPSPLPQRRLPPLPPAPQSPHATASSFSPSLDRGPSTPHPPLTGL